jgi:hypothetical protein
MQRYRLIWLVLFSLFFVLMLNITLKYVSFQTDVAFLQIKQTEVTSISLYIYIFYVHVITSIVTLLAGFTQFNSLITRRFPKIHVALGRIYVYSVLVVAAPSGIYIGWYANGGITSKIAFISLGILWWLFTLIGVLKIKRKNLILHSKWMHRSFALACSAITLRLWKVILVYLLQPSPMELYQIIAWLGWIPNLLLIEFYIKKK